MKKLGICFIFMLCFGLIHAQKMAYVDTQAILKQISQYQQAEQRLNNEVEKWKKDILDQQANLEKLRLAFENEKVLLTDEQQKNKMVAIDSVQKNMNDFIDKKFGTNGESTTLRFNLLKPVQDQLWNAINAVAVREKYNIIFDKSSDLIFIYSDARYDITDKVLKQLGVGSNSKTSTPNTSKKK